MGHGKQNESHDLQVIISIIAFSPEDEQLSEQAPYESKIPGQSL